MVLVVVVVVMVVAVVGGGCFFGSGDLAASVDCPQPTIVKMQAMSVQELLPSADLSVVHDVFAPTLITEALLFCDLVRHDGPVTAIAAWAAAFLWGFHDVDLAVGASSSQGGKAVHVLLHLTHSTPQTQNHACLLTHVGDQPRLHVGWHLVAEAATELPSKLCFSLVF